MLDKTQDTGFQACMMVLRIAAPFEAAQVAGVIAEQKARIDELEAAVRTLMAKACGCFTGHLCNDHAGQTPEGCL